MKNTEENREKLAHVMLKKITNNEVQQLALLAMMETFKDDESFQRASKLEG